MKKITLFFIFSILCLSVKSQILTEGFEGGIPAGWTQTQLAGTTNWTTSGNNQNSSIQPRTGSLMAYFYVGNYTSRTRLETPSLDLTTVTTPVLTFYYTNVDWGGDTEELRVFYKNSSGGAWNQLAVYTVTVGSWTEVNIVLPNPTNDYYIGFEAKANWGRGLTIDDVLIDELSGCLPPGSLNVLPTSVSEAQLSWVAAGSEGDWTYEYGLSGYTQGSGAIGGSAVTAEFADISSLTVGETYDFYVQANCGGTDGDSTFTGPYTWTQPDTGEACGTAIVANIEADCGTATPVTLDFSATSISGGGSCDTFNNIGYWLTTTTDAAGGLTINTSGDVDVVIFSDCLGAEEACYNTSISPSVSLVLSPNTQYYMYFWNELGNITSVDVCMESYSPAPAPECATAPITPADGATGLPAFDPVTLSWTAPASGPTPTSYDVYVGTMSDGSDQAFFANTTDTFYEAPIGDYDITIYWSIVPLNGLTPAAGCTDLWSFTSEMPPPPPANDDCSGAIPLTPGVDYDTNPIDGSVTSATVGSEVADCGLNGPGVWYSVVVPDDGNIIIEVGPDQATGNTGFDSVIEAFSGVCGSLVSIDCDDDGGATGNFSILNLTSLTPGDVIYIRVWEYNGDEEEPYSISAHNPTLSTASFSKVKLFTYYPNPVDNTLSLKAQKEMTDVSVYNMLGQVVVNAQPNAATGNIDMTSLQSGAYFVKVTIGDVTETVRIIKN
ncbi:T9SS type A sorting domain-containing protein [Corallibacter sp.]|uniref:T9SS type A sorting domain-containing protein n=1 Tax=Corallibacter sp. TaxID=2038084 RepID=UPI003A8DC208